MSDDARLLRSAAYLPVPDVASATSYYQRVFGFTPEYVAGTPPMFAIIARDGLPLMLRHASQPIVPNERQGGTWDVFFWVSDVHALHRQLAGAGAEVVYGPVVQDAYDYEEFDVRDPNGYVLGFGQPRH